MTTSNIPGDVIFGSLALKRATERTATTRSSISATRSWASKSTRKRLIELIALDVQRTADTARWSSNSRASGSSSKWWWIRGNLKEKRLSSTKTWRDWTKICTCWHATNAVTRALYTLETESFFWNFAKVEWATGKKTTHWSPRGKQLSHLMRGVHAQMRASELFINHECRTVGECAQA